MNGTAWRVVSASVPGANHVRRGCEGQDAHRHAFAPGGALILAVADGAGSRRRSAEGSAAAVGLAVQALETRLSAAAAPADTAGWRRLMGDALREVAERFAGAARALAGPGGEAREFATTLSAVVVALPWIAYAGVGDGFMVVRTSNGRLHVAVPPDTAGEYANEAVFLTSPAWERAARVEVLCDGAVDGVALSTDGLRQAALEYRTPPGARATAPVPAGASPEFLGRLFRLAREPGFDPVLLYRSLRAPEFEATSGDDKTLVLATLT